MRIIYIIVHEEEVKTEHDFGLASSIKAYREIQEIKRDYDFRNVEDQTKIPDDLPPPGECEIHVCGSSLAACVPKQMEALEEAGYKPILSRSASVF
jgi:hypothetical protein